MNEQNYNTAFVFPGQGSQSVGMMSALATSFPVVEQTFEQASDALGYDLWGLVRNGPEEALNQTHLTQPAMLAAGVSMWRVWCAEATCRPGWMAGHSLGEYTALVCSNAISFDDAVSLVSERGRLMQQAVPAETGAMAAIIGLQDHQVVQVCAENGGQEIVSAVNFNAPGQVVIAGDVAAVERTMAAAKKMGAKRAIKLPVSVPSHCQLMEPAAAKLSRNLARVEIRIPDVTLIHNVDVSAHTDAEVVRNALREQLFKPVRWVDTIRFMFDQGVSRFVECGPGKVLLGMNKRIVKSANHFSMSDPDTLSYVLEHIDG